MKSIFKYIFTLLAIYLLSLGSVLAEPALVIGLDGCGLLDGYGDGTIIGSSGITVSASSANGNVIHTCSADVEPFIDENDKRRTKIWSVENTVDLDCDVAGDGIEGCTCGLDDGSGSTPPVNIAVTDDWHQVVSASGKAKLVCHFKD